MSKDVIPQQSRSGGRVETNWSDIRWNRKKLLAVVSLLGFPYLATVVATFVAGMTVITLILSGVALFVGMIFMILRWLEQAEL